MKKHIPNIITCFNLFTGCLSITMAFRGYIELASYLILVSALFDFMDGMAARLLNVHSVIGKDLDSLADNISFGIAPAILLYIWLEECYLNLAPSYQNVAISHLNYLAFIVPVLSAVRLAKFNHDERQTTEFRGLATPANALFIGFIHFAAEDINILSNFWVVLFTSLAFSIMLVSDLPMFSLKFHNFKFKDNWYRYLLLFIAVLLFAFFQFGAFPVIILIYLFMSLTYYMLQKINII